jgi:hypothetical protein
MLCHARTYDIFSTVSFKLCGRAALLPGGVDGVGMHLTTILPVVVRAGW